MSRPFPLPRLILLVCAAALPLGCRTVYSDVYSPRGNKFKAPVKTVVLPPERRPPPGAAAPVVPAAGEAAPLIPGLVPVPDMGGLPAPAVP